MGYRSNAILQCCACTPKRALFSRLATIFFGIFFLSSAAIAQPNNPFGAPPNAGGAPAAAPNPGQPNTADAPAQETALAIKILLIKTLPSLSLWLKPYGLAFNWVVKTLPGNLCGRLSTATSMQHSWHR